MLTPIFAVVLLSLGMSSNIHHDIVEPMEDIMLIIKSLSRDPLKPIKRSHTNDNPNKISEV